MKIVRSLPTTKCSNLNVIQEQSESEIKSKKIFIVVKLEGVVYFHLYYFIERGWNLFTKFSMIEVCFELFHGSQSRLNVFSGLRNRLYPYGVNVITVKPGYVRTKMTSGLKLPKALTTNPEKVSSIIYEGYKNKKDILYVLPIWKLIMILIKLIPQSIFKRKKL